MPKSAITINQFDQIISDVRGCQICANKLPLAPNPIIQMQPNAKVLIIGQAPGLKTHQLNMPFKDKSGERLRDWLGVSESQFYNPELFAIMPMAFCYPGKNKSGSGDAPPPKICQKTWHLQLLALLPNIKLTIFIGSYAAKHYLESYDTLENVIQNSNREQQIVLPHPSPRNNIWLKKNNWFETKTLPKIQQRLSDILNS